MGTKTKIFGLVGYPVKHSLSAFIHNAAFNALGIDARYELFEVRPEELFNFLEDIEKKEVFGLNVTVPHKEKVLGFISLDRNSLYLEQVKAVNTIVKKDGRWKGFNTDITGFSRDLRDKFDPRSKSAAILGAGGGARAVVYALFQLGIKEISIYDLNNNKSIGILSMMKGLSPEFRISSFRSIEELNIERKDLLVNATPVGLKESDPCLVDEAVLHKDLFVYDLIYNPPETKILALAKKVNARNSNGLGMLLYQGALAFEHFTGRPAPLEVMREALCAHI